jgi:hypothetical protein
LLLLLGLVGCYSPTVHSGAPCGPGGQCPGELVCAADQTCQPAGVSMVEDAAPPAVDAGIDAAVGPPNDQPDGAIDVTDGGDFTADLTNAHDDASKPANQGATVCGDDGAPDVFYTVHLGHPEVFYFDTFGSDFDTIIRVFSGGCSGGTAPNNTSCHNNAPCGNLQTQWVGTLPGGDSCIVVDGTGAQTGGAVKLHVERGHHDGTRIAQFRPTGAYMLTGDTTGRPNFQDGSCSPHGAPEVAYYYVQCPGDHLDVTATTCNAATAWDTMLYAKGPGGELACQDDDFDACPAGGGLSTLAFTSVGAHLYWIVVDGAGGTPNVGPYELDVTFP